MQEQVKKINSKTNMPILRVCVMMQNRDRQIDEFVRTCESIGSTEVSMFSDDYLTTPRFVDRQGLDMRMEHLTYCANRFRKAGLTFTLNVMHTLGHIMVPEDVVQKFGFARQINADGKPNVHPVLDPRCPNLRENLAIAYEAYGTLKPRLLFVDDDFKLDLHNCFYEERLREFAERFNCEPDRLVINKLINSSKDIRTIEARALMYEIINRDLEEMAVILRKAVHKFSPQTRLGLMFPSSPGCDIARMAQALAGDLRPFVRSQTPMYREELPLNEYPAAFWSLSKWRAELPENVEHFPESENYPYTDFTNSPDAIFAKTATLFGFGTPSVALSLNSFFTSTSAGESRRTIEFMGSKKNQLQRFSQYLDNSTSQIGIALWQKTNNIIEQSDLPQTPVYRLQLLGLPCLSARKPFDAKIHFGLDLATATEQEIKKILVGGTVFDIDSISVLRQRNLLHFLGCEFGNSARDEHSKIINFTRFDGSNEYWPLHYFIRNLEPQAKPIKADVTDAQVVTWFQDSTIQNTAPFAMKWTGPNGQHFAFINFSFRLWPAFAWLTPWTANIFTELFEWVNGSVIPVQIQNSPNVVVQARAGMTNRLLLLTVTNFSTGSYEEINLILASEFRTLRFFEILTNGKEKALKVFGGKIQLTNETRSLAVRFVVGKQK